MEATQAMIPIIGCICICLTIFGIYYLRNKENMALIDRGINPREGFRKYSSLTYLKYGLLLIGAGLGLFVADLLDNSFSREVVLQGTDHYYRDNSALYFSLIGIGGGLGLVVSYIIERKAMKKLERE